MKLKSFYLEERVAELNWREGLFENFQHLIEIQICKINVKVPEKNTLLRCFQYLKSDSISVGDYCWNGDCTNCQIWYRTEDGEIRSALACRMYVKPGLVITTLSEELKEDLI